MCFLSHTLYDSNNCEICDIVAGLKATKCGKPGGVDGLASEHFIYADESFYQLHLFYSIYFLIMAICLMIL